MPLSDSPRSSISIHRPTGFLSLPRELRDEIYNFVFADLHPASFFFGKPYHEEAWYLARNLSACAPGILLVSKDIHAEAKDALCKRLLSGPEIFLQLWPEYTGGTVYDVALTPALKHESEHIDAAKLAPVLRSIRSLRMGIMFPASYEMQAAVIALVRWIATVLATREIMIQHVRIVLRAFDAPPSLWPKEGHGIFEVLKHLRCESMEVLYCYKGGHHEPWSTARLKELCGPREEGKWSDRSSADDVERAWQMVLESGKREYLLHCGPRGKKGLANAVISILKWR